MRGRQYTIVKSTGYFMQINRASVALNLSIEEEAVRRGRWWAPTKCL